MGIARGAVALLLEEAKKRPFHGRLATLGRQTIYTTASEIARQFDKFQIKPHGTINLNTKQIVDNDVFRWMGFDNVESLDYSDFEGATHVVDLNKDSISQNLVEAFDVVLDSGTLEHVFHFPNALKNTLSLLKVGGRMIFLAPSSNHLDHGFYMFSPTLFADYFLANGFRIETMYMVRYSPDAEKLWDVYNYQPGEWRDRLHIGGLDGKPYAIWVVATRLEQSTFNVIPQQNYYADTSAGYAKSRLATGETAEATVLSSPISASPPPITPVTTKSLMRQFARQVPGVRRSWHVVQAGLNWLNFCGTGKIQLFTPRKNIFRKNFVGKY